MENKEQKILYYCKVNSVYNGSHQFAHFYLTEKEIVLTRLSIFNMCSSVGTSLLGTIDGEGEIIFRNDISKLKSISKVRFRLNAKCCLFDFGVDRITIIFDSPKKTLESISKYLTNVTINF